MTHQPSQTVATTLKQARILPVIAIDTLDQASRLAEALLAGGLTHLEITLRTPVALDAIRQLKQHFPQAVIGAGTVTNVEQIRQVTDAGADFIVTPGTPLALAEHLANAQIAVVPGGATATEFMTLRDFGFRTCKFYPAMAMGGTAVLKGLYGPLADMQFCPTGGVTPQNMLELLALPNVVCVGGSWMISAQHLQQGDYASIEKATRDALQLVG